MSSAVCTPAQAFTITVNTHQHPELVRLCVECGEWVMA